jgi:hypothetical protein
MMDNTEADNFRRIQLMSKVEWTNGLITQYRENIDHYHKQLGHIAERLGEPEEGDQR